MKTEETAFIEDKKFKSIKSLEQTISLKDKALSIVIHDLKGPVNSLKSILSIPQEEMSAEENRLLRGEIVKQLHSISETMNSLFCWASREFSNKNNVDEQADICAIVVKVTEGLANECGDKQIKLNINLNSVPAVLGSAYDIEIVLRNIILNAIKFTRSGGTINVAVTGLASTVNVTITDNGVGMTPQQIQEYKNGSSRSTPGTIGERGSGLGLMLCKYLIERNGGSIEIESEKGAGTEIIISFSY